MMPERTTADIKRINVYTQPTGHNGWLVDVLYFDGKQAEFYIDPPSGDGDMLQLVTDCIKKQLKGSA